MWNLILTLILGPFALWFNHLGKLRQRGSTSTGPWLALSVAFASSYFLLWFAPLRWEWIAGLYLFLGWVSFVFFRRLQGKTSFQFEGPEKETRASWREGLALAALVVYPILFGYGLVRDIDNLRSFSIHLPSSVYVEALTFAFSFGTPGALVLAFLIRRAGLKPGIRLLLYLYAGALVTQAWIGTWERFHEFALGLTGMEVSEPLLFNFYRELSFRNWVHGMFYTGAIFLGTAYLASARRNGSFLRRAVFLALPAFLGYANFVLLLGEGGYFVAGLREHFYREEHYDAFSLTAQIETARLPHALHTPYVMMQLADLAALQGREKEADRWRQKILQATQGKPYASALRDRVLWEREQFRASGCKSDSLELLSVPRARPAATLDGNWYGLISAVSYFRPDWSDFDLKKRLLEVSPDIQLSAPSLKSVPALAEVLDVFGLPFSPLFLDSARIHLALREGKIPFLNIEGRWVPVVGWDACRREFLCYRFSDAREKNPWLNPTAWEMVLGGDGARPDSGGRAKGIPYNLIGFLPEHDLLAHLHDIGGVALVLGDSNFASSGERKAAYLAEYGDGQYQEFDDNRAAAEAYARAQALYPSDYLLARMTYLERRVLWSEGPDYGLDAVFRAEIRNAKFPGALDSAQRGRMAGRISRGEMGQYLLLNWHEVSFRFFTGGDSAQRDSSREIFRTWLRLHPNNPAALDSLATGFQVQAKWDSAETYYRRLMGYYPMGNESAAYRLSWVLFKQGRFGELKKWLARCPSLQGDARHLLMRAAGEWEAGQAGAAHSDLKKSLKLDRTLPESHALMEKMALVENDSGAVALARRWRERTGP